MFNQVLCTHSILYLCQSCSVPPPFPHPYWISVIDAHLLSTTIAPMFDSIGARPHCLSSLVHVWAETAKDREQLLAYYYYTHSSRPLPRRYADNAASASFQAWPTMAGWQTNLSSNMATLRTKWPLCTHKSIFARTLFNSSDLRRCGYVVRRRTLVLWTASAAHYLLFLPGMHAKHVRSSSPHFHRPIWIDNRKVYELS